MREGLIRAILVMLGGSLGALCRFGVSRAAPGLLGSGFPWGTLAVNLSGCFLIGVCFSLADRRRIMGPRPRLFFVTGFLGALTTFSSFAFETVSLMGSNPELAALNILSNNIPGLLLVVLGMRLGRLM